jgi:hypothetical protein
MAEKTRKMNTGELGNPGEFARGKRAAFDSTLKPETLDSMTAPSNLSFDGPLERLSLQSSNYALRHFTDADTRDWFVLDPEYQRGSVWGVERKQNLVRSLLMGLPIGAIAINKRDDTYRPYAIVDGRQRIEAIRGFIDDEYPIPAAWLQDDWVDETVQVDGWPSPGVTFSGGTRAFRRFFEMRPIAAIEGNVRTIAEEAEIFRLINSGGIEQTTETMERAAAIEG